MSGHRLTASLLAVGGLLAGCSTVTVGRAVPADHDGPKPVPDSALGNALLDAGELDTVMGASGMQEKDSWNDLLDDTVLSDESCLASWQPIQKSTYSDSGWSALRSKVFYDTDKPSDSNHHVVEAVVGFKSRTDVADFFDQVKSKWTSCGDRKISVHSSSGSNYDWEFSASDSTATMLSVTITQTDTNGWSCQRVVQTANNVVIDVNACTYNVTDEGKAVAKEIDAKLPSI